MKRIIIPLALLATSAAYSQVGIGTLTPNASAQLEVVAQDKGILIPRVKLTSTTDATTITSGNVNSLLVFNTETIADITPGYYYWYINKWYRILADGEGRINDTFTLVGNNLVLTDNKGHRVQVDLSALRATETLTILKYEPTNGELSYQDEQGNISRVDLKQVVNNYQTLTTLVYDQLTGLLTYKDEQGNTHPINLTQIIKEKETLTILSFDATTSILTYKDEDGVANNINLSALVPANETLTKVIYHATTGMLEYKDEAGASTLVNLKDAIKDHETLTALTYNSATGALTYKDEDGVSQTYTVGNITNLALNPTTGKITYTDPTGPKEIDLPTEVKRYETLTSINYANGTVTYTPERGNQQTFAISAVAKIEPHPSDKAKLRYTMLDGTQHDVAINETITELKEIKNADNQLTGFSYKDEAGNTVVINLPKTSLEYDKLTGDLKYTPTYGPVQVVNIKAANVPFEPDPAGTPNAITATNVQDAIKQINNKIAAGAAQVGDITGVGTDPIIKVTDGDDAALKDVKLDINDKSIDANKLKPSGNAGQVLKVVDTGAGVKEVQYSTLTNADINSTASIQSTDIDITNNGVTSNQLVGAVLKDITLGIKDDAIVTTKIKDKAVTPNKIDSQGVPKGHVLTAQGNGTVLYEKPTVDADDVTDKKALKTDGKILLNGGNVDVASTLADVTLSIAEGAITSREILNGTIATEDLANNAVTSDKILNNTIKGEDIANKTIGAEKLDPTAGTVGQVLTVKTDPATGEKVVGYETPKVTSANVDDKKALKTDGKITLNGGTTQIPSLLADVELSIAEGAITSREIANNTIQGEDIANETIGAEKLNPTGNAGEVLTVFVDPLTGEKEVRYESPKVTSANVGDKKALKTDGKITLNGATADVASTLADVTLSIGANAITSTELADNAVTEGKINNGAVTNNKLGADAVTTDKIANGTIKGEDIANETITANKLVAERTDAGKVATVKNDGTVAYETPKVTSANVDDKKALKTDGKITLNGATTDVASTLADVTLSINQNAITGRELADNAVTSAKIQDGEVKTADLANSAVDNTKLADNAVTSAKIQDGEVKTADLADNAVTTQKINDKAVTAEKLNAGTGNEGKVPVAKADGTVTFEKPTVASGDVTDKKGLTTDGKILLNGAANEVKSLLADVKLTIAQGAIGTNELADNAVTSEKIANGTIKGEDIAANTIELSKINTTGATNGQVPTIENGQLVYKTPAAAPTAAAGGGISSTDLVVTDGDNSTFRNVTLAIKDGAVTNNKLNAGTGTEGRVPVANTNGTVEYKNLPAQSLGDKKSITTDGKILVNAQNSLADAVLTDARLTIAQNAIGTNELADNAVTKDKIDDNAVTSDKILNGEVKTADIDNKAVTAEKLNAGTGNEGKVPVAKADGTVTFEKPTVASGDVSDKKGLTTDGKILLNGAANEVKSLLTDVSLSIAQGAITSTEIKDGTVTNADLADNAVTSNKIADGTIKGEDITNKTIGADKLVGETTDAGKVPVVQTDGTVRYENPKVTSANVDDKKALKTDGKILLNGAVADVASTLADVKLTIAEGAITTTEIANNTIKGEDITNKTIGADKLVGETIDAGKVPVVQTDGTVRYENPKVTSANVDDKKALKTDGKILLNGAVADVASTLADVTLSIKAESITATELASNAVTSDKIAAGAVETSDIKDKAVTAEKLNAGTGTAGRVPVADAAGNITYQTPTVDADDVTDKKALKTDGKITLNGGIADVASTLADVTLSIKAEAITATELATDAVTESKIKADAVTTDKIKDGNVTPEKLSGNIPADKITGNNLTSTDIDVTGGAGTTLKATSLAIKTGAITNDKLAADAVTTDKIATGAVETSDIKDKAVTDTKLADNSVSKDKIQTDAVTTEKIKNESVTPEKLSGNIPADKITGNNLTVKDGLAITGGTGAVLVATEIGITSVDASKLTGTINNDRLSNIPADKITSGTLSNDRLNNIPADKIQSTAGITSPDASVEIGGNATASVLKDVTLKVGSIAGEKITSGTIHKDRLPGDIPADKVQSTAGITSPDASVEIGGNATASVLKDVTLKVGSIAGEKITSGTIHKDRLPGDIPGSKIETNTIAPDKIQRKTLASADQSIMVNGGANSVLNDVDLSINKVDGSKITDNTITNGKIQNVDASKITSGTIDNNRLSNIPADKIAGANLTLGEGLRFPTGSDGNGVLVKATAIEIGEVNGSKITNNTIDLEKLKATTAENGKVLTVEGGKVVYKDPAPTTTGTGNITSTDITVGGANNALLGNVTLAINNLDGSKIANNTITKEKIASVDGSKIENNTITNDKITSVEADKVTSNKTITGANGIQITGTPAGSVLKDVTIGLNNVDGTKIQDNTIPPAKINSDKTITEGDNIKITGTPAGSVLKDVTIAVEGKDLTLGKALEFKDGTTGQKTVLKETKIDLKVGASIDARETNYTIKVAERKRTGATAEEMLVIDANGDLQKMKFRRQQFYMPSVVLPTQPFAAGTYGTNTTHDQASGFFTINLYDIYKQQFSLPVASSNTSAKLEVFAADALDYFVVYVDDSVIDTANMTLSASGVLKYKVKQNAVESEKTFMNIVFQEKD